MKGRWITVLAGYLTTVSAVSAASISFKLVNDGASSVEIGGAIILEIRADFDTHLSAAAFELSATGSASVTMISRSADPVDPNGLSYLSGLSQIPFDDELPHMFSSGPKREVLYDADFGSRPGSADDGVPPGSNIVTETVTLQADSKGYVTISLARPTAAHTQSEADGMLFDDIEIEPGMESVTILVGAVLPGDADGDGDVDLSDYETLVACRAGPCETGVCTPPLYPDGLECQVMDPDMDGDVDLVDFKSFQLGFTGQSR